MIVPASRTITQAPVGDVGDGTVSSTRDGLTLWYGGPDTPAPLGEQPRQGTTLVVGVAPVRPFGTVMVLYRIDDGPVRQLPAGEIVARRRADQQRFRATFPTLPAGSTVRYQAVSSLAGQVIPAPAAAAAPWSSFRVSDPATAAAPPARPGVPATAPPSLPLEHLTTCHVRLGPPEVIGQTPNGLKVNWWVTSGWFAGPRLRGTIRSEGADWMTIRPDGIAIIDVRATMETDDGALISADYGGVFELGPDGHRNFLAGRYPEAPEMRGAPRYATADERYAWLNRLQCVVAGRVDMGQRQVVYDVFGLVWAGTGTR